MGCYLQPIDCLDMENLSTYFAYCINQYIQQTIQYDI